MYEFLDYGLYPFNAYQVKRGIVQRVVAILDRHKIEYEVKINGWFKDTPCYVLWLSV